MIVGQAVRRLLLCIASIAAIFVALNFFPLLSSELLLDVETNAGGNSQLFYPSSSDILSEERSIALPISKGRSLLAYPLGSVPRWVRWDPNDNEGSYAVHGAAVRVWPIEVPVDLRAASPGAQIASFQPGEVSGLNFTTQPRANDPSIVLALPSKAFWIWQGAQLVVAVGTVLFFWAAFRWNAAFARSSEHIADALRQRSRDFGTLGILVAISVLCYFYELGSFSLSIDDEYAAFRSNPVIWVSQGRWTTYLIERYLLWQPVVPFFPTLLFCLSLSLAYLILTRAHGLRGRGRTIGLFPVFCAFPVWPFIAEFYANLPAAGLGLLLVAIATFVTMRFLLEPIGRGERWLSGRAVAAFLIQAVLVATAVGAYQSYLLAYGSILLGTVVLSAMRAEPARALRIVPQYACAVVAVIGSALVYFLIQTAMQSALSAPTVYIEGFLRIAPLLAQPIVVLKNWLSGLGFVYLGSSSVYGTEMRAIGLMMLLGLTALALSPASPGRRAFVLLGFAGSLLAPFLLHLMSEGRLYNVPFRSLVGVPYVVWLAAVAAVSTRLHLVRWAAFACAGFLTFQVLYTDSLYLAAQSIIRDQDRYTAQSVYDRMVAEVPDFDQRSTYKIDFYGQKSVATLYPKVTTSAIGSSFFDWDGGNPHRIVAFMRLIGFNNIEAMNDVERRRALPLYASMPLWPAKGSMQVVDGMILVKLGDKPGSIHQALTN